MPERVAGEVVGDRKKMSAADPAMLKAGRWSAQQTLLCGVEKMDGLPADGLFESPHPQHAITAKEDVAEVRQAVDRLCARDKTRVAGALRCSTLR